VKFQDDGLETKSSLGLDNRSESDLYTYGRSESETESVLSIVPEGVRLLAN
jgi:hypothetical protein